MKRILMTTDAVGGIWTFVRELIAEYAKSSIEVVLACMGPPPDAARRHSLSRFGNCTVHTNNGRLEWMDDPWNDVEMAGYWLLDIERENSPDIVHLNSFSFGVLPFSAPVLVTAHSCVFSWFRYVKNSLPPASFDRYKMKVTDGLHGAALVCTPTYAMRTFIKENYGVDHTRINVIHNGRTCPFATTAKEPFIFTAGRLYDEAKNIGILNAVARRLPWPVIAAGDTVDYRSESVPFRNIRLTGFLSAEAVQSMHARASIYASPALYEPFGLSVLEAAAAQCTLVLSRIDTFLELWDGAAFFIDPYDEDELYDVLRMLTDDERLRIECGKKAALRAMRYLPDRMAAQYLAAYNGALKDEKEFTPRYHERIAI